MSGDDRETTFLFQRISVLLFRFNSVLLHNSFDHAHVNAISPPIAGERVGVEGWGGNGHLLEAYSTEPTCKPQSTMCSF